MYPYICMETKGKTKITLSIDEKLLQEIKIYAIRNKTNVSRLFEDIFKEKVR